MISLLQKVNQIKILQMQKSDKLTELKQLKQKLRNTLPKNNKNNEIEGQIIQILRPLTYFKGEAEMYGIEILMYYIPLIEPYILRAGMQIISNNQDYVVVEGVVKGVKASGMMGNVYTDGMIIDPSLETYKSQDQKEALSSTTECDTKLIKIIRNSNDPRLNKHCQNLNKFQKQRLSKQRDMQRMMISDKSLQQSKQKLQNFQFFQSLGSYDLNQLVINSKILYAKKCTILHEFGSEVNRVGFLLYGQVKVDNSVIHKKQKPFEAGRLLLEKYMIHKKQHTSSVASMVQKAEWIGLEEYLWGEAQFLSHAEVVSFDAEILYIPTEVFSNKFNSLTSYYLMSKLKGLIETKKKILDKQIKTKRQKQDQIKFERMRQEALQKMQQKIDKNYQTQRKQKKSISPDSNAYLIKSRKKQTHKHFPSQCYMPDRLVHKIKVYQQKYESLPKIQQRFVLFPQEYEKAMIPLQLRQELKAAKNARNKTNVKNKQKTFKLLSNEKVYETVIYASLSPKSSNPQRDEKSSVAKLKSKASIDYSIEGDPKMDMLETIGSVSNTTTRVRFNASIFNNFRAPKNKGQRLLQNITKTLQII